ncbi:MAG: hypothetical protein IPJ61_19405 [Tessaracoccus sp.]|uniref:hypothetical protein n=1 Tax=Tessaracoccus sp. TaxID=1971211 RepID=UPI001ECBF353|nr:hypothetical protein [Tessaracoccus sp.]MBK7823155.1 hypothetical protein [Tessaracoccus sp.]
MAFKNAKQLITETLTLDFFQDDPPAIPYVWTPAKASCPLVTVVGENAGGKSFFRRCVSAICREAKREIIPISMEGRRKVAYNIGLVFVYGDEEYEATGVNSINTVLAGIKTCRSRETPHVIFWDEPDIGLSEGNAASVGRAIADFTQDPPEHTIASIVVTHRKSLVTELRAADPHYLYLGDAEAPQNLDAWLTAAPVVRPLEEVQERAHARYKAIQRVLNRIKERRSKP